MNKSIDINFLDRSYWNANPIKQPHKKHTLKYHTIVVHHTAVNNKWNQDLPKRIKSHQHYHTNDRNWPDICYHYLISKNGSVIQGRDIDIISSPHNEIDNPKIASVKNNLDGIISVCLLGNFEEEEIEHTQYEAWIKLLKHLYKKYKISLDKIYMHQNCVGYDSKKYPTLCPGKNLKKYFLNDELKKILNN